MVTSVPMFGGQHGVVYFGPRNNPQQQRWWAERGLIHLEDATDNSYHTFNVRQFLHRLKGVNDMLGNSRQALKSNHVMDSEEITRHQRFVEEATDLARKAQEQGMPSDRSAVADLKRRRPLSVQVPGLKHTF